MLAHHFDKVSGAVNAEFVRAWSSPAGAMAICAASVSVWFCMSPFLSESVPPLSPSLCQLERTLQVWANPEKAEGKRKKASELSRVDKSDVLGKFSANEVGDRVGYFTDSLRPMTAAQWSEIVQEAAEIGNITLPESLITMDDKEELIEL